MIQCSRCGLEFSSPPVAKIEVRWVVEGGHKEYLLNFANFKLCPQCHKELNKFMRQNGVGNDET